MVDANFLLGGGKPTTKFIFFSRLVTDLSRQDPVTQTGAIDLYLYIYRDATT